MTDAINNMIERRSIRKYKPEKIKKEELDQILEAGLWAPSGRGMQAPILIAIQDKEARDKVAKLNAAVMGSDADPFYGAPTVIVVLAARDRITAVEDGSACLCNMVNAAHSIGIDSCWIHRAKEVFDSEEGKALLREWGVEGDYIGVGNCILGYRDCEYPAAPERKEGRVFRV